LIAHNDFTLKTNKPVYFIVIVSYCTPNYIFAIIRLLKSKTSFQKHALKVIAWF